LTVIPTTILSLINPSEKELRKRAEKMLEKTVNKIKKNKPDLKITTKILVGRSSNKIVENAQEGNFDMIVIGSRGLGGVKKFLLGRTVNRVADKSTCSVIIVK
jgi:nucleotide-binding universal stress UspA family protein